MEEEIEEALKNYYNLDIEVKYNSIRLYDIIIKLSINNIYKIIGLYFPMI